MRRGPQTFDLPVANLSQLVGHYVPPPARDQLEIERRQNNPKNTVILEAQTDGVKILGKTFDAIAEDLEVRDYFAREMGSVCLNTAWYSYANIQPDPSRPTIDNVGRRRLELPKHARIDDEGIVRYETALNNQHEIEDGLSKAALLALKLEAAHKHELETVTYRTRKQFGHMIGNVGLRLAATPLIGQRNDDPYDIQTAVRDSGRDAIEHSRELHEEAYPTVAQLIDLDSELAVYLRRKAPTAMRDALINATAHVQEERRVENNV
jgi:hypothetical protein